MTTNKRKVKFTFFNSGNSYDFDPAKRVSVNGELVNNLKFHLSEVAFRNSPDVYVVDDTGTVIKPRF